MNKEELIRLKEQLQGAYSKLNGELNFDKQINNFDTKKFEKEMDNNKKYYIGINPGNLLMDGSVDTKPLTIDEIESLVDTDGVVKQLELGIEKSVNNLSMEGINFDGVSTELYGSVFLDYDFVKLFFDKYFGDNLVDNEAWGGIDTFISENFSKHVLPYAVIGFGKFETEDLPTPFKFVQLQGNEGVVDLNDFIKKTEALGYEFTHFNNAKVDGDFATGWFIRAFNTDEVDYPFMARVNICLTNKKDSTKQL
jgi:hypothetical protein